MAIVDELVTILGFEADTGDAKKMKQAVGDLKKTLKQTSVVLAGLSTGVAFFGKKMTEGVAKNSKLAETLGINIQELQELQAASVAVGGSIQSMSSDLANLDKMMADASMGELNDGMVMLGLSIRSSNGDLKSSSQLVGDLADKFDGLNAKQAMVVGAKLGISEETVRLLRKGREELGRLKAEARASGQILDEKQVQRAREFEDSWASLKTTMTGFAQQLASDVVPTITKMIKGSKKWIEANKGLIKSKLVSYTKGIVKGIKEFVNMLKGLYNAFSPLLRVIAGWTDGMSEAEKISKVVSYALSSFLVLAIMSVVSWVGTLIVSLKALFVVIVTNPIGLLVTAIIALVVAFAMLWAKTGSITEALKVMGQTILQNLLFPINLTMKAIAKLFELASNIPGIGDKFSKASEKIKAMQDKMNETLTGTTSITPGSRAWEVLSKDEESGQTGLKGIKAQVNSMMGMGKGGANLSQTFHINGARDPKALGQEISGRTSAAIDLQMVSPGNSRQILD